MKIVFGAGRLAQTLAAAFFGAGWAVEAFAGRSVESSNLLAMAAGGNCNLYSHPQEAVNGMDLIVLTVLDDAIQRTSTHLAAATTYAALFKKYPLSLKYNAGLAPEVVAHLQQVA
jgi:predicted dinucleotide-binding enzyme